MEGATFQRLAATGLRRRAGSCQGFAAIAFAGRNVTLAGVGWDSLRGPFLRVRQESFPAHTAVLSERLFAGGDERDEIGKLRRRQLLAERLGHHALLVAG